MSDEHRDSSGGSAALVAVGVLAVLFLVVCGGLAVAGLGMLVYLRAEVSSPPQAMQAPLPPTMVPPPPPPVALAGIEVPKEAVPGSEIAPEATPSPEPPPTTSDEKP